MAAAAVETDAAATKSLTSRPDQGDYPSSHTCYRANTFIHLFFRATEYQRRYDKTLFLGSAAHRRFVKGGRERAREVGREGGRKGRLAAPRAACSSVSEVKRCCHPLASPTSFLTQCQPPLLQIPVEYLEKYYPHCLMAYDFKQTININL